MFTEENVDIVIDYMLDLTAPEMKTLKLLISNGVTQYKALEQVIDSREQKIEAYLRKSTSAWKSEALSKSYNKCFITGLSRPDRMEVHHAEKSFDIIVREAFAEVRLIYRPQVRAYSPSELRKLSESVVNLHKELPGIVMLQEVHQLYHKEYGVNNNTMQQLYAFKKRFELGEFKIVV